MIFCSLIFALLLDSPISLERQPIRADVIEVNHCGQCLDQLIIWRWEPSQHKTICLGWKHGTIKDVDYRNGQFIATINGKLVIAKRLICTTTEADPERADWKINGGYFRCELGGW